MTEWQAILIRELEGGGMSKHYGMPGPGGSMGRCSICGEDFTAGVLMDMMGMPSGITLFSVEWIDGTLYGHKPKCIEMLSEALWGGMDSPKLTQELLPNGPLKEALGRAIEQQALAS